MSLDQKAYAYYDQNNYTEAYFVLPNKLAFFIPDVGANRDTQVGFGSEAYLQENKFRRKNSRQNGATGRDILLHKAFECFGNLLDRVRWLKAKEWTVPYRSSSSRFGPIRECLAETISQHVTANLCAS